MNQDLLDKIDDRLERRFESYAQVQQKLHEQYHNQMIDAVESQIKITVNGKIDASRKENNERFDAQDKILKRLDSDTSPLIKAKSSVVDFFKALLWLCGFISVVGGAIFVIKQFI